MLWSTSAPRLVLVMGHEKCGAVQATLGGGEPGSHIQSLVEAISPAIAEARKNSCELLNNAVRDNVQLVVKQLRQSGPILADQLRQLRIKIVAAIYELDRGTVLVLPQ